MPAGPAPTMTTSYSRTVAKGFTCKEVLLTNVLLTKYTALARAFGSSVTNVTASVDDDRLSCHVVSTEEIEHRLRNIIGAAQRPEWRSRNELVSLVLRPSIRQQHGAGSDGVDADPRRERVSETARHLHDAGLGDRVRDLSSPRLERGQVRDVYDRAAPLSHDSRRRLTKEERRAKVQREHRVPILDQDLADWRP